MYLDCSAGIAGDMFLGGLFDAGVDPDLVRNGLAGLNLSGYEMRVEKGTSHGIAANSVQFNVVEEQPHRYLKDIMTLIEAGNFSENVKSSAGKVFSLLAQAEAKVHGTTPDKVHFHEVGAIDSICDIIGTLLAVESLEVERIICSPLSLGSGHVHCAHGRIPVPAPATLEIIKGVPVRKNDIEGELVTPTGAALAVTLSQEFSSLPSMIIDSVGYGMGTRDYGFPSVLRVIIGRSLKKNGSKYHAELERSANHPHTHDHFHVHKHAHEHKHDHDHEHERLSRKRG